MTTNPTSTSLPKTAHEIYLEARLLHRLFSDNVPKDLIRFVEADNPTPEKTMLDPVLVPYTPAKGRTKSPDVVRKVINGIGYVLPKQKTGVSLFDGPAEFTRPGEHYVIPEGTPIPPGLVVTEDNPNPKIQYVHYSIGPSQMMEEDHFVALLRKLASHAIKMAIWMTMNPNKVYSKHSL